MPNQFLERLRWLGRLFLLLFVLGAAAFLSAITAMRFAIEGRVVEMPNLIGKSYASAQTALRSTKLGVVVADHAYSKLPMDDVVRQSPPPGTHVKVGQLAQVVLSLGPRLANVPSLIDLSLPAARLQLLNSGMQLGEVSYIYSAGEPPDLILQQDPLPGRAEIGSPRVSVLVSLGPRPVAYVMPHLTGLPAEQVEKRLAAAGLPAPTVTAVVDPVAVAETVVGQTPSPGARVDGTTAITLQIAAEPGGFSSEVIEKAGTGQGGLYAKMRGRWR
jgi:beta-lactam-binding protein with PASTA domain